MTARCAWVDDSKIYQDYHDKEWGIPVHDDQKIFEMLLLESFQAGLSWITILKKREDFRIAFDSFDPVLIADYGEAKIEELLTNEKIIRNRRKVTAAINNARLFLEIQKEYGSFDQYIWNFTEGKPIVGNWKCAREVPATTELSDRISKELKERGFQFVGSTIVYSFMQSIGMVNDHTQECFLYHKG